MSVHEYRKAIDPDCIIGVCSQNNCLYPDCVLHKKLQAKVVDPDRGSGAGMIIAGACLILFMLVVFR
jgi:hypothetical protein